ncbi:thymidine phosphorylase [Coriobacterium glomerans PW2]|uniref:Thymidine phosphorylase n=1 Tax=Coriobacterium glomerans (strain ATCC 49209 / DSM 20642 / JCM 10262 / PW2) TaxID=700015 RepID=F2NB96_CORGP|nr:thymidine phosphorylase [Coriobacterium glomerans]AEB06632.1 thymidine phosphorylase [Coriobacterium glomerans PW2]
MRMYDIIERKRDGRALSEDEISFFVSGLVAGDIPDYQASALLMAIFLRGMDERETLALTLAMEHSGDTVDLSRIPGVKLDKHSTGGVGDKTTLAVVPIVASLGVNVAKMSGRGLGHTGGTLDKLESIPGLLTSLDRERFETIVREHGAAIVGQSGNLVPADKLIYALRDVTATVGSIPLIASSIMSKKLAAGADKILLDVKCGSGAFMKTPADARRLAECMVGIGAGANRACVALITNMDRPLGRAIGNALEVVEVVELLHGRGPADLERECVELAANMLLLAGRVPSLEAGRTAAGRAIVDGSAFERLREIVAAQGGDIGYLDDTDLFVRAPIEFEVIAPRDGFITAMDTTALGVCAVELGAGREHVDDEIDYAAGITLIKTRGDVVRGGEPIARLHTSDPARLDAARPIFEQAVFIGPQAPAAEPLVLARVCASGFERFD